MTNAPRINDPSKGGRWGIMGGTFDPVHLGHLVMAESVMQSVNADGMLFVPAKAHPLKTDRSLCPYRDRLDMVAAAIRGNDRFRLEKSPGDSGYTIDLIDYLCNRHPRADLFLVVGSDIVAEFSQWHKHEEIEQNIKIVVAARPGYRFPSGRRGLLRGAERVMIPQYQLSSSDIRERLRAGLSIRYMVPEGVRRLIETRGLYAA